MEQLIAMGLQGDKEVETIDPDINFAWRVLSQLGFPGRYGGKTQDGYHEYLIANPLSGTVLTSGRGMTLERAICAAVLKAHNLTAEDPATVAC